MERLMVVDGHSLMNRAFYAMGNVNLTTPDGRPSGALYNFYNMLMRYLDEYKPTHLVVAFDLSDPTFRHEAYADYKAGRKPMPDDLRVQFPMLRESLDAAGITYLEQSGLEADDLIGCVSQLADDEHHVYILSGDRDTLQLVNDNVTQVMPQNRGKTTVYDPETVEELHGIRPDQVVDLKALMGDSSDNIPGVKGIGVKTATKFLQKYDDIDTLYAHLDELTKGQKKKLVEGKDSLELSKKLAKIQVEAPDTPLEFDWDQYRFDGFKGDALYQLFMSFGFQHFIDRMNLQAGDGQGKKQEKLDLEFELLTGQEARDDLSEKLIDVRQDEAEHALAYWEDEEQGTYYLSFEDPLRPDHEGPYRYYSLELEDLGEVLKRAHEQGWVLLSIHSKAHFKKLEFYPLDQVFDVEVATYLMGLAQNDRSLDNLAQTFLTDDLTYQNMVETLMRAGSGETVDDELAHYYEGQILHNLWRVISHRINEHGATILTYDIEMPLIAVLAKMENTGVLVDQDMLNDLADDFSFELENIEDEIYGMAGHQFNVNSPKQLAIVLFDERGNTPGRKTSTGNYSTDADELERLKDEDPIVELILDYRTLSKLLNTSVKGLQEAIADDGRIHSTFHQSLTQTGRLSSSDPNLQNIPVREEMGREIRRVFMADEDKVLLDADYSQIELRLLASLSADEAMLEAFKGHSDVHKRTAASMFEIPEEDVTPEQRAQGKTINFSIIYGISAFGLARNLRVPRKQAQDYIDRYYERYPGVKAYMESQIQTAKDLGYVETYFGRRRYIPELKSSNYARRQFGERVAMNTPIQGTAADLIKYAMVRTERALRREGSKGKLVLQIHDELILEVPEDEAEKNAELLQIAMEGASDLPVPLEAEVMQGKTWLDANA